MTQVETTWSFINHQISCEVTESIHFNCAKMTCGLKSLTLADLEVKLLEWHKFECAHWHKSESFI